MKNRKDLLVDGRWFIDGIGVMHKPLATAYIRLLGVWRFLVK